MQLKIEAVDVINALFNPTDIVNIRIFSDKKSDVFSGRNLSIEANKFNTIVDELREHNKQNRAISFVVNTGGASDEDITKINAVFVDMDDESFDKQEERIKNFKLEPSMIIRTRKSLHTYWFTKDVQVKSFRPIQKALCDIFHGDKNCQNESRCLRLPGFNHCKEEPIEVKCIKFKPEIRYTEQELLEALPNINFEEERKEPVPKGDQPGIEIVSTECEFIHYCEENAKKLSEHDWYAMITNLMVFKGGEELIHKLSKPYDGYTVENTQRKINHFIDSGTSPITCKIIAEKGYKCKRMEEGTCHCKSPAALCYVPISLGGLKTLLEKVTVKDNELENVQLATKFIKTYLYNQEDTFAKTFIKTEIKEHFTIEKDRDGAIPGTIKIKTQFKNDIIQSLIKTFNEISKTYIQGLHIMKSKIDGQDAPLWYQQTKTGYKFMPMKLAEHLTTEVNAFYGAEQRYLFDNGVYKTIDIKQTQKMVQNKLISTDAKMSQIADAESQWMLMIEKDVKELNANPYLINLKNGNYNLLDNTLRGHDPKIISTIQLNCSYNENAKCERFIQYLNEVMGGNQEQINLIQEMLGYVLIPTQRAQKCFILEGAAQAGKSVLLNVIADVLVGRDNVSSIAWQSLNERFLTAELFGKLVNVFADLPTKNIDDNGIFKALLGEDLLTVEKKHKDPFKFKSVARLIFSCNQIPKNYGDKSEGFYRRLIIIKFKNTIPKDKKDPFLLDKLKNEADGILQFALVGLKRLIENNYIFSETQENIDALRQYREESDSILSFIAECCTLNKDLETTPLELYNSYTAYCQESGLRPYALISFIKQIKSQHPEIESVRINGKKGRALKGIKFTQTPC